MSNKRKPRVGDAGGINNSAYAKNNKAASLKSQEVWLVAPNGDDWHLDIIVHAAKQAGASVVIAGVRHG